MKKSVRCSFFETTGSMTCPFHKVKLVGELSYYALKRIKRKWRRYGKQR